jgi:tellurium resistance protein TerZ
MAVSLTKGQTISLAKDGGAALTKVFMGLGWDPVASKPGLLGRLFGGGGGDIDLDASLILVDAEKKVLDTISFQKLKSSDGSILHSGDNLTGAGDGDDEVIHVNLGQLPAAASHMVFTVSSFRGQTFNEVENAFARLVDGTTKTELCKFTLTEQGAHTGVIMASMSKTSAGWQMTAHGKPCQGRTVKDLARDALSVL